VLHVPSAWGGFTACTARGAITLIYMATFTDVGAETAGTAEMDAVVVSGSPEFGNEEEGALVDGLPC
jgi:hypothetical protein